MNHYLVIGLLIVGLINIQFFKKLWIFAVLNLMLFMSIVLKSIAVYKEIGNNLISSPIEWLILYEIRYEVIVFLVLLISYFILKRKNSSKVF